MQILGWCFDFVEKFCRCAEFEFGGICNVMWSDVFVLERETQIPHYLTVWFCPWSERFHQRLLSVSILSVFLPCHIGDLPVFGCNNVKTSEFSDMTYFNQLFVNHSFIKFVE